ncbi:MAG: glycosyl hydrolase family 79 C-terminal domain-containing protein [Actinomycetota bacterium]|nr:glycosyl hydrolase family 79 C-terminal domain-containing protein [Actinomycetota bacterium]
MTGATRRVPRSFLGISTEYWTVPVWARHLSLLDRVFSALTADGPMVLRIGGSSADQTFWAPIKELPEWVFEVTPAWLKDLHRIVNRSGVRVILDLNLVTSSPKIAVRWARAAEAFLPTESIVGFEIGNEGDIYSPVSWRKTTQGVGTVLPARLTATSYARSFAIYAKALARVDRGVPLFGPALSDPIGHLDWISRLLTRPHPGLRAVTVHRYPLSACSHPGQKTFPTIARVLSENSTAGMARGIRGAVRSARRAGLPVRLTEINSVTCGGRRGVSNTFATSLWAPDALFELLKVGAISAAVHVRANAINMAFSLTRRGLIAHPLLYGLIIFSRTLGPHPQLVPLHLWADPSLRLKVWAVRSSPTTVHILLINKGRRTGRVSLHVAGAGPVSAQQMLAPSARAESGVTLDGQRLDARGHWVGRPTAASIPLNAGAYTVTVRQQSATLVTVPVSRGPLRP